MSVNGLTHAHFSDLLHEHERQNLQHHAHVVNLLNAGLNAEVNSVGKETRLLWQKTS